MYIYFFFPLCDNTYEASQSHSVGYFWPRDHPVAETSTSKHTSTQQTDFHIPGGIRTRNPRKRAAADLLLRPRSTCDQLIPITYYTFTYFSGISYVDNVISIWDPSDVIRETFIDLYIMSAFVFTFKVLF